MVVDHAEPEGASPRVGAVGLVASVALFGFVLAVPIPGLAPEAQGTLAVTACVATCWLTQAMPIPAASLLPLVLLPALRVSSARDVARLYVNESTFLFLGGFLLALAIERCGLHRRIADATLRRVGGGTRRLSFALMAVAAFASLWMSNTAATLMLLPMGLAVVEAVEERRPEPERALRNFGALVVLGIAFGSSIGGVGTPIGTPPNALFFGQVRATFPDRPELALTFAGWMIGMVPLVLVFLPAAWWLMSRLFPCSELDADVGALRARHAPRAPWSRDEKVVGAVFATTVCLWVFRQDIDLGALRIPGWSPALGLAGHVDDAAVAMLAALALFVLPSKRPGKRLLDWSVEPRIPWGILLLFGAGFAIAGTFESSGLSAWFGETFAGSVPRQAALATAVTCVVVTLLSELANNTATAAVLLPVSAGLAEAAGTHPFAFMLPVTVAASSGFMLPIATPPNAIAFATGRVTVGQMARCGILLDLLGVALVTFFARTWWALVLHPGAP